MQSSPRPRKRTRIEAPNQLGTSSHIADERNISAYNGAAVTGGSHGAFDHAAYAAPCRNAGPTLPGGGHAGECAAAPPDASESTCSFYAVATNTSNGLWTVTKSNTVHTCREIDNLSHTRRQLSVPLPVALAAARIAVKSAPASLYSPGSYAKIVAVLKDCGLPISPAVLLSMMKAMRGSMDGPEKASWTEVDTALAAIAAQPPPEASALKIESTRDGGPMPAQNFVFNAGRESFCAQQYTPIVLPAPPSYWYVDHGSGEAWGGYSSTAAEGKEPDRNRSSRGGI